MAIVFALWTLLGAAVKVPFLALYLPPASWAEAGDWLSVLWHGLLLDAAIGGYLTLLPGMMMAIAPWYRGRMMRWVWDIYFAVTALLTALAYVSNIGLYSYWGFPLDSTPLLYIRTSPSGALASMETWQLVVFPLIITVMAAGVWSVFHKVGRRAFAGTRCTTAARTGTSVAATLLTALLIIPIRGGFGTGTNHTGNVYFSADTRLNHAAVNPVFSFVESATHQEEIATRYRFMDGGEADALMAELTKTELRGDAVRRDWNVVMICLESFSKYIMGETGNVSGVTPNLDRYAKEGIYFTRFFANTTRTDRALVAILSGLPAQPTMSIMDQPRISTSLPSIASTLGKNGYTTHFYYGGDMNYSNMNAYIMGTGFQKVTSEVDFSQKERTGKWGAPDGTLFARALDDINGKGGATGKPFLKVILTGSSHEPFDVPGYKRLDDPALNAFAYADNCLGTFMEGLRKAECWENTLVVIVPAHLGAYPPQIDNYRLWRYEIPLIMTGGVVTEPKRVETVGAQTDICATVLGMLGLPHNDFIYSKDLLDNGAPHFAFFTFPDAMGMVEDNGYMVFDNVAGGISAQEGPKPDSIAVKAKALLQKLYDDIGQRALQ